MIKIIDSILTWIGQMLKWFESFTGSYVVALLIFSLIVEILFLPFAVKQQKNQIKQAKLRPKEMAIRNKYKGRDDQVTRQKMQQEITDFYAKENYNPMAGCLPLLIQLPIILALYQIVIDPLKYVVGFSGDQISQIAETIKTTLSLEAAPNAGQTIPFINYIKDIAAANGGSLEAFSGIEGFSALVPSVESLPNFNVFGNFNLGLVPSQAKGWLLVVPLLVYAFQLASSKLSRKFMYQAPSAQDANVGCSNSVMDYTMPLMSAFFAYTLPAAVGVYWISKNVLTFVKQVILAKAMPMPVFTEADYKAAEKEMNAKAPKKVQSSGKVVRSLHHIDDEDFEDTREEALRRKAILEEEEKKAAEARAAKMKSPKMAAPLKDDKNDNTEENSEENK